MFDWIVENRDTGVVVYAYAAEAATGDRFPFAQYNHRKVAFVEPPAAPREISGVSYLRRFTQDERIAIRDAAKESARIDDYLKLLDITIAQGGVINLDDTDTVAAVALLEQVGLLAQGRGVEILA